MGTLNDPKHTGFIYYQNTFYREQDNLVSSAYYHLKEFSNVVTENDYIKKNKRTREQEELEGWHCLSSPVALPRVKTTPPALSLCRASPLLRTGEILALCDLEMDLKRLYRLMYGLKEEEILLQKLFVTKADKASS
ncbi:hypothetical protein ACEU2D_03820 [Brevibacillus laterosporus]|uniref:hypothetical protein n=1 Tax=Brevibacillus laterosporus TaxID=1465 RepID=UPI0035A59498